MQFKPKTEEEISEAVLLQAGKYMARVAQAEETVSKQGNEMIKLRLTVWDESGGERTVFDYLLEAMAFKLRHFCEAAGLMKQYESGNLQAGHCEGKEVSVELGIEPKRGDYAAKNTVKDYAPLAGGKKPPEKSDEDLPF